MTFQFFDNVIFAHRLAAYPEPDERWFQTDMRQRFGYCDGTTGRVPRL